MIYASFILPKTNHYAPELARHFAFLVVAGPSFRLNKRGVPTLGKLVIQYAPKDRVLFGQHQRFKRRSGCFLNS